MKKINSIGYGGKVIFVGILFTFIFPLIIYFTPYKFSLLHIFSKISFVIGVFILVLFSIWLKIELYQDKKTNGHYDKNKNKKLSIGKGKFECQACGNQQVKLSDRRCSICGIKFI